MPFSDDMVLWYSYVSMIASQLQNFVDDLPIHDRICDRTTLMSLYLFPQSRFHRRCNVYSGLSGAMNKFVLRMLSSSTLLILPLVLKMSLGHDDMLLLLLLLTSFVCLYRIGYVRPLVLLRH